MLHGWCVRVLGLCAALAACLAAAAPAGAQQPAACLEGFDCLTVTVPLDRSGAIAGTLELPVAVQRGDEPVLLALGGGPGQGMVDETNVAMAEALRQATGHRVAMLDQRGTGAIAIDCPALQRAALTDFTVPPRGAVAACGELLGGTRGLYATTDTVADLDAVRDALGVERWALFGVSYGTYVAARYARAHPDRVTHLVLDSVVPQENVDPFSAVPMRRSARVLRQLCARGPACAGVTRTPARDLRRLVHRVNRTPIRGAGLRIDGPALFDLVASLSSFAQTLFPALPTAVDRALDGDPALLVRLAATIREMTASPDPASNSWGLHAAALCADGSFPWGSPATAPADRRAALDAAARRLPRPVGPFDRATAAGNGVMATCLDWPATDVAPPPEPGPLPDVPVLLLAGTWDLSTPVAYARTEARRAPSGRLVVLPEVGHAAVFTSPCGLPAIARFFAGEPLGRPCAGNRAPRKLPAGV